MSAACETKRRLVRLSESDFGPISALRGHQQIALDSNVLIYLIETQGPLAEAAATVVDRIVEGHLTAVLSAIGLVEILTGPARAGNAIAFEMTAEVLRDLPIRVAPLSVQIAEDAAWIRGAPASASKMPSTLLRRERLVQRPSSRTTDDCGRSRADVIYLDTSSPELGPPSRRPRRRTRRPAGCPILGAMDLTLTPAQLELQARARAYVVDVLQPLEAEFERLGGRVPRDFGNPARKAAIEARLHGGSLPGRVGGQGWSAIEQVLVHEQLGQVTGGLWSYIPGAYNVLIHCDPEQRARYLDPCIRGERSGSYAITEDGAGSDARTLQATAVRDAATGEYVLNGEKWFVTGPDDTDFMIFHANVVDGERRLPTLFLVDYDTPGVRIKHDPDYMHTFADRHPQFVLEDVRVPAGAILGGVGAADELTNEWFVEERIHIGARCSGAMERLLTLAVEWATERVQFGERIYDFQGVSFPLADSAADASAARLLTRECAWLVDTGADPKVVHAKASLAKLFASEAAFRCADRVVQVFGGRGYMREFPAERFFRELRVDRIWEGTSRDPAARSSPARSRSAASAGSWGDAPRGR